MADNRMELTAEQMDQARALRALCNRTTLSMKEVLSLEKGEWYRLSREACETGVVEHAKLSLIRDFLQGCNVQEAAWLPVDPPAADVPAAAAAAARPPRRAARHANYDSETDPSSNDDDYPIVIETIHDSSSSGSSSSDMDRKPHASVGQYQQQRNCDESEMAESNDDEVQIQYMGVQLPEGQLEDDEDEAHVYDDEVVMTVSSQSEADVASPGMHSSVPSSIAVHNQSTQDSTDHDENASSSTEETTHQAPKASHSHKAGYKRRCPSSDGRPGKSKKKYHSESSSCGSSVQIEVLVTPSKASLAHSTTSSTCSKEEAPTNYKEPKKAAQGKARETESKNNRHADLSSHSSTSSSSQIEVVMVSASKVRRMRSNASRSSSKGAPYDSRKETDKRGKVRATESKKNGYSNSSCSSSSSQLEVLESPSQASVARSTTTTSSSKEEKSTRHKDPKKTKQGEAAPAKKAPHKKPYKKLHKKPFRTTHQRKVHSDKVEKPSGSIYQLSMDKNKVIRSFQSFEEAGEFHKTHPNNIRVCCEQSKAFMQKHRFAFANKWSRTKPPRTPDDISVAADSNVPPSSKPAAISQSKKPTAFSATAKQTVHRIHSKDRTDPNNIIETFSSINQAAKMSKIEPRGIQQCCMGQIPHTHDQVFVFASQYNESTNVDGESDSLTSSVFVYARNDSKRKITSRKTANNSKFANKKAPPSAASENGECAEPYKPSEYSYEQFLRRRTRILKRNRRKASKQKCDHGPSDIAVHNKSLFTVAIKDAVEGLVQWHIKDFLKQRVEKNVKAPPKHCVEEQVEKQAEKQVEAHVEEQSEKRTEDQVEEQVEEQTNECTNAMVTATLKATPDLQEATRPNVPNANTAQKGPGLVHKEYEFVSERFTCDEASDDDYASVPAPKNDEEKPIPVLSLVFCSGAYDKDRWERELLLTNPKGPPPPQEVTLINEDED